MNPKLKVETFGVTAGGISLASISDEGRSICSKLVSPQAYQPGIELYRQGGQAQDVYFIDRGLIKLTHLCAGGEELIVDLRSSGWILGAASAIIRQPLNVSAVTLTTCHLRRISKGTFLSLLDTDPQFCW